MVKLRSARYCNLKLLLIYLVVYGHWIEAGIWGSPALKAQYRWIYLVHMPLFAFLSGLFLKSRSGCAQQLKRALPLYALLQTAAVLLGNGTVKPLTPFWHLWYLLSLSCWAGLAWLWFRFGKGRGKLWILAVSVLIGCAAGYVSWIGRPLSVSRTLVFFPYFWAGVILDPDIPWKKLRLAGLTALALAAVLMHLWGSRIGTVFLYQAAPYGNSENGFGLRLLCYTLGALLCLFLLSAVPDRRFPFTRAGADTMPAYLIHAPLVGLLRQWELPWVLCPLLCAGLLYGIYKILQWRSAMFGIVQKERRDSGWPHSSRSTKNTANRSTDSCCP